MINFKIKNIVPIALAIAVLVICWAKMTAHLSDFQDILATDETYYLHAGVVKSSFLKYRFWAPFYSVWYGVVHIFESNRIELYYLNQKLMALFPIIAIFIMLLAYRLNLIISFIISFGLLVAYIHFPIWPKVSHFAVIIICSGMIIIRYLNTFYLKTIIIGFTLLALGYCRPEFFLPFFLTIGLIGILILYNKFKLSAIEWLATFALAGVTVVCTLIISNALLASDRNMVAFYQHFALNYSIWNDLSKFNLMDYENIAIQEFNNAGSYSEAFKTNSPMFLKHVFTNIKNYIFQLADYGSDILLPHRIFNFSFWPKVIISFALAAIVLFLSLKTWTFDRFKELFIENKTPVFFLTLITLPTFIACILIYPRDHYHYLQLPLFLFVAMIIFQRVGNFEGRFKTKSLSIVLLGIVFFIATPTAGQVDFFNFWKDEQNNNNVKAISAIKKLSDASDLNLMQAEGQLNFYIRAKNLNEKLPFNEDPSKIAFTDYIKKNDVNCIYLSNLFLNIPYLKRDQENWDEFVENHESKGWHKLTLTPNSKEYILVRNDIWNTYQKKVNE